MNSSLSLRSSLRRIDGRVDGFGEVRVRRAQVVSYDGAGLFTIDLDGVTKAGVPALQSASPRVGQWVRVDFVDGSPLIVGPSGPATALVLESPDGTRWAVAVTNAGALSVTAL